MRIGVALALIALSLGAAVPRASGQDSGEFANKVKAGFVYNFAKFVDWPEAALASRPGRLVLGVLGEDSLARNLREIDGRTAQGRRVEVRALEGSESLEECQLIYVSANQLSGLPALARKLKRRSVLIIGDSENFIEQGGMIQLFIDEGMVRFAICPARVRAAGLLPSAKLMRVAKTVDCRSD